jgi:hypothetical protein
MCFVFAVFVAGACCIWWGMGPSEGERVYSVGALLPCSSLRNSGLRQIFTLEVLLGGMSPFKQSYFSTPHIGAHRFGSQVLPSAENL